MTAISECVFFLSNFGINSPRLNPNYLISNESSLTATRFRVPKFI